MLWFIDIYLCIIIANMILLCFTLVSKVKSLMEAISIGDICEDEVPLGFQISLPLSAYTDASVKSVDILHNRVKSCAVIPSGTVI